MTMMISVPHQCILSAKQGSRCHKLGKGPILTNFNKSWEHPQGYCCLSFCLHPSGLNSILLFSETLPDYPI